MVIIYESFVCMRLGWRSRWDQRSSTQASGWAAAVKLIVFLGVMSPGTLSLQEFIPWIMNFWGTARTLVCFIFLFSHYGFFLVFKYSVSINDCLRMKVLILHLFPLLNSSRFHSFKWNGEFVYVSRSCLHFRASVNGGWKNLPIF